MKPAFISLYRACHAGLSALGLHGVWPLPGINRMVKSLLRADSVVVHGKRLYLDHLDSMNLSINRAYEPLETALVKKLVQPGDVVLDIGAHVGFYSVLFSDLVGDKGQVTAFEPDPDNYRVLMKNVRVNGCTNVTTVNKAVSALSAKSRLYLSARNTGDHQIYDTDGNRRSVEIETTALDDYFDDNLTVDVVKMDIQGSEYMALMGMRRLLKRSGAVRLISEFCPYALRGAGVEPEALVALLEGQGFEIEHIDDDRGEVVPFDMACVLERCKRPGKLFTNLLCTKEA